MKKISIKQGATLSLTGSLKLPVGDWGVTSQIRDKAGVKCADCVITPSPVTSADANVAVGFVLTVDETITTDFPATTPTSLLQCDIFFRSNSFNLPTETFALEVENNVTDVPAA